MYYWVQFSAFCLPDVSDYGSRYGDLLFLAGSVQGALSCVDIDIVDDHFKELNESFTFALCEGGDKALHLDDFYSVVGIVDDDSKSIFT